VYQVTQNRKYTFIYLATCFFHSVDAELVHWWLRSPVWTADVT